MQLPFKIFSLAAGCLFVMACSKKPDDYRSFLDNKEVIYPGGPSQLHVAPGNGRVQLSWVPNSDPSITRYTIHWNNGTDSVNVKAGAGKPGDTVKCIISNLKEYAYTFIIRSFDAAGNSSAPKELNNVKVYGDIYQSGLGNRPYDVGRPGEFEPPASATLYFSPADTINIATYIRYTDTTGLERSIAVLPDSSAITITDYEKGTALYYRSSYVPVRAAIDTFYVQHYDSIPGIN